MSEKFHFEIPIPSSCWKNCKKILGEILFCCTLYMRHDERRYY